MLHELLPKGPVAMGFVWLNNSFEPGSGPNKPKLLLTLEKVRNLKAIVQERSKFKEHKIARTTK